MHFFSFPENRSQMKEIEMKEFGNLSWNLRESLKKSFHILHTIETLTHMHTHIYNYFVLPWPTFQPKAYFRKVQLKLIDVNYQIRNLHIISSERWMLGEENRLAFHEKKQTAIRGFPLRFLYNWKKNRVKNRCYDKTKLIYPAKSIIIRKSVCDKLFF